MNLLVILPYEDFMKKVIEIVREVYGESDGAKICYLSLNKPYVALERQLKEENTDINNFIVIDSVTKTVVPQPSPLKNCVYISSPTAVEELLSALSTVLEQHKFSVVILDSLSTLLIYSSEKETISFAHRFLSRVAMSDCEGIVTCLKEDAKQELVSMMNSLVDRVVDLSEDNA